MRGRQSFLRRVVLNKAGKPNYYSLTKSQFNSSEKKDMSHLSNAFMRES